MKFSKFSNYLQKLEETPSRLDMTEQLSKLFENLSESEIEKAVYLLQGRLTPRYERLDFNLSTKMVIRALARIKNQKVKNQNETLGFFGDVDYSQREKELTREYKKLGDLGLLTTVILERTTEESGAIESGSGMTITEVFNNLKNIALDAGEGSQDRKVNSLVILLNNLDALSAKFVVRVILGKMRLGFSTMTMLDALSWSMVGDKSEATVLEMAYNRKADLGILAKEYLSKRTKTKDRFDSVQRKQRQKYLEKSEAQVQVPVVPELCQRLNTSEEIIEKLGKVIAEPKYDGMRLQIHFNKNQKVKNQKFIKAYTRNLDEVSHMFPELEDISYGLKCKSCILDAEVIGVDKESAKLLNFQQTIKRKRKHEVEETASKVPVRFYVFDVLECDGESLIDKPLRERKKVLESIFDNNEQIMRTDYIITNDVHELRKFHEDQLAHGLEGAVMKAVDSKYVSGRKGWNWVKIKEKQGNSGKLNDTLDLVVMGYYYGRGKRTEFGLGALLVGVNQNEEGRNQKILTIAKIGTGLSDDQLKMLKKHLSSLATLEKPKEYEVHKNLVPDVWVEPKLVVEIAADEITKSPVHTAGVALRFPRLIKVRNDKSVDQATDVEELNDISI